MNILIYLHNLLTVVFCELVNFIYLLQCTARLQIVFVTINTEWYNDAALLYKINEVFVVFYTFILMVK